MNLKKKWTQKRKKELLAYVLFLAIPVLQFIVFYIGVNFNSILLAFKEYTPVLQPDGTYRYDYAFAGFENFKDIIAEFTGENPTLRIALTNSFLVYAISLVVSVPLALLFSFYIFKKKFMHKTFQLMLFLPSIISGVVMAVAFTNIVDRVYPEIMGKLTGTYAQGLLSNADLRFWVLILFSVWVSFGSGILLYSGAMSRIPPEMLEAARIDGVNDVQEFWHMVFPMVFPTLSTLLVVGVAGIFMNQLNLYTFFPGGSPDETINTLGYYLFFETARAKMDRYPYLAAFGVMITIVVVPLTYAVKWALNKFGYKDVDY